MVGNEHPGMKRVLVVAFALALYAVTTYLIPGLHSLRPWVPGTSLPFSEISFAWPSRHHAGPMPADDASERSDDELLALAPLPRAPAPASTPPGQHPVGPNAALRIPPEAYAGMTRPIESPDDALSFFHRRLRAVAMREPGAIARIALYSVSTNGADRVSSTVRQALQARFGDSGKGWVPIAPGWQWQQHLDVRWSQEGRWRTFVVNRGGAPSNRYGFGGVVASRRTLRVASLFGTATRGPVGAHVGLFRLFYQAFPEGGNVALSVDGGTEARLPTQSATLEDRVHDIHVTDGAHELRVGLSDGDARLYGVVMERENPGVVVDGLMLIGAFTRVLLNNDAQHWQGQIAQRQPDLLVFWLGDNESVADSMGFDPTRFRNDYGEVIRRARQGRPEASCLVMSVLDSAVSEDGVFRSRRRIPRVVAAQRQVAQDQHCAFFDSFAAMGGPGAIVRWVRSSPRLASGDYQHLTEAGSRVLGALLYKALLKSYDDWLDGSGPSR